MRLNFTFYQIGLKPPKLHLLFEPSSDVNIQPASNIVLFLLSNKTVKIINHNMKNFLFITLVAFLLGCNPKTATQIPEADMTMLDTMVITAPRADKLPTGYTLDKYNPSAKRDNDLVHTQLDLRFDWEKEQVIGKAVLTLQPVFYPVNSVTLDAKGFTFSRVAMQAGRELQYDYDGKKLKINLPTAYKRNAQYTLEIDYVASPSAEGGSAAISSDKGLFFINPRGEQAGVPQQIWTQGETEHNSKWFPTIDKPNERTTQDLTVTVDKKFKTLSNGLLISSKDNPDGTRTDRWKSDIPHAPYLFALVVGDFAVVQDKWNGLDVDYYVEPEYKDDARAVFPYTPEMLTFFSETLDMPYPWQKYSQVVVREFVSGAMENTTAVIFGDFIQKHERELIDDLTNEKIVAHEMFHHWFGDYVTTESWANLTLNEGFANYSEYLWLEEKYGRDAADLHWLEEFDGYLGQARSQGTHPLIHYHYDDKEEMFDAHSYNKGGMVLHMLRHYLGDEAFFAALNKYLKDNALSDVEVDELRMAFEDTTGEDLNWFFNQWYLEQGHPNLEFSKFYNPETKNLELTVIQTQDPARNPPVFELPIAVDIYTGATTKTRETVRTTQREQTFMIPVAEAPVFVDIDPEKVLLAEKTPEAKSEDELIFQFQNTRSFANRLESVRELTESSNPAAGGLYQSGLQDDFWVIRLISAGNIAPTEANLNIIKELVTKDPHSQVRQQAVLLLSSTGDMQYKDLLMNVMKNDRAYSVQAAALEGLRNLDPAAALAEAKSLEGSENSDILSAVGQIYVESGDTKYLPFFEKSLPEADGFGAIGFYENYGKLVVQGDKSVMQNAANKLEKIGADSASPFQRFAAVKTLNDLYLATHDRTTDAADEQVKTEMTALKEELKAMIIKIKEQETEPQLKTFYSAFPTPLP